MEKNRLTKLVKMARKKNNAAIEELYREYYVDVKYICSRYNLNDADSSDIAQETFIKAFDTISTLDNPEKFPAWLGRIASNKCIDLLRHNKTPLNDTVSNDELMTEITDEGKTVEEIVIDKEVKGIISDMISRLPSEQQITVFMYYYQDYSIKEIAAICGCSENTVKSRMHYARKFMRNEAEKLEDKGVKLRTQAMHMIWLRQTMPLRIIQRLSETLRKKVRIIQPHPANRNLRQCLSDFTVQHRIHGICQSYFIQAKTE